MKANTPRQKAIHKALRALIPLVPYGDFVAIAEAARGARMRDLSPVDGAFLATVAHIRHRMTDYDSLLAEGYDQDSARFFVADTIDDRLREWGAPRGLNAQVPDDDGVT